MMKLNYKILLVHNPFDNSNGVTYLSYAIRVGTNSHWNHIAIELEIDGELYILESVGKGVIITKKEVWLTASHREILERSPLDNKTIDLHEVIPTLNSKYGYVDLLYISKYIINRRLKEGYTWNGDVPKGWEGFFCSELAAYLMHIENPHLVLPCDFEYMIGLINTDRYFTYKI